MNGPERLPTKTRKPFTGYLWGALAVLTCPCHLPILAVVLAGTTAGAYIGEHAARCASGGCWHGNRSGWPSMFRRAK